MSEKISIIVPVYNVEKTLKKCVDSLLLQTHEDIEIILSDDGSKDSSGAMCDQYASQYPSKIKVIHHENGGLSAARNRALEIASGDYIGFVDSDDWCVPNMYEYLLDLLKKSGADISMIHAGRSEKEMDYGDTDKEKEEITYYQGEKEIMEFFYRIHGEPSYYAVNNRLYKKEHIGDVRFLEGYINEDVPFTYAMYKKSNKLAVSNLNKYFYYRNPQGITRNGLRKRDMNLIEIWDQIVEQEKGSPYEAYAVLNRKRAAYTLAAKGVVYGRNKDFDPETYKALKKEVKENYEELKNSGMIKGVRKALLYWVAHTK